jgi:hypothetical protein
LNKKILETLRSKRVTIVAALFLMLLPLLLQSTVPMAYACGGLNHHSQNQVNIDSVTLSSDGKTLIVKVSVTIKADKSNPSWGHTKVRFMLTASYGSHELDPRHDGTRFFRDMKTVELTKRGNGVWYAEATFNVPYKGYYYYLFQLDVREASHGTWIGGDWVDPREGTAPE